jgi:hypothetical protein
MTTGSQLYLPFAEFIRVRDGNNLAAAIANRHYSRIWRGNTTQDRFMPPGRRLILVEPSGRWLFAWNMQKFRHDGQFGAECTIFRNESELLSSDIILLAERECDRVFGFCRKFTYIHPGLIRSTNPGYCFQKAGWTLTRHKSTRGLALLIKEVSS